MQIQSQIFNQILGKAQNWKNNTDAENTAINLKYLKENVAELSQITVHTTPWVFSHVPKTAGTSLENYLIQPFELKDVLHVNAPDLNRLPQVIHLKNKYPNLIMGHHPIHGLLYQLLPKIRFVHLTMLREPVSRIVSYYNYLATRDYHVLHSQIKDLSFDSFLKQDNLVEIHNGQSKRLTGYLHSEVNISDNDLYFKAKEVVDNCFTIVGVTEYFKEFCHVLEKQCGIIFNKLPPVNRSQRKIQLTDLRAEHRKSIEENNKVDIQLYQYVKSKFEKIINH